MNKILILIFATTLAISCKKEDTVIKGYYDYVRITHEGSDPIDFKLYPTNNSDSLKVVVTKFHFRDTTLQFNIGTTQNDLHAISFSDYYKAINNQEQINGSFRQSELPTGEFSYVYTGVKGKDTEVTNTDLRNSLIYFEQLVKNKLSLK